MKLCQHLHLEKRSLSDRMARHVYRQLTLLLYWIFLFFINEGMSELICPNIADVNSPVQLSCTFPSSADSIYLTPDGNTVATCVSGRQSCIISSSNQYKRFTGIGVNRTQSNLEIQEVHMSDEGDWICEEKKEETKSQCNLVLRKTPSCIITSSSDPQNLTIGDEISLSVHIEDYYCSRSIDFILQTGNTTEEVITDFKINENQTDIFNSTFTVSESHFGYVELRFTCNGVSKRVKCDGIQSLTERQQTTTLFPIDLTGRLTEPDNKIAIIGGALAAILLVIGVIVISCLLIRRRNTSSKHLSPHKAVAYSSVSDKDRTRLRTAKSGNTRTYADIPDICASSSNQDDIEESTDPKSESEMVQVVGCLYVKMNKKDDQEAYSSDQPDEQPLVRDPVDDTYARVSNTRSSQV